MKTEIPKENFFGATIMAIILAYVLTALNSWNIIFRIGKKLKVTSKNDNLNVWEGFLDSNRLIVVRDSLTQKTYYGILESYSDNSDFRELFMKNVDVRNESGELLYQLEAFYMSRNHNEFTIETFGQREDVHNE